MAGRFQLDDPKHGAGKLYDQKHDRFLIPMILT
jgi:hypothetical protein